MSVTHAPKLVLNTIALEPNRWTEGKIPWFRLFDLIDPIRNTGFTGLEFWEYHIVRESPEHVKELREKMDSVGMSGEILGLYPSLHRDGEEGEADWDRFRKAVVFAKILGVSGIKMFAGTVASAKLQTTERKRSIQFLQKAAEYLAEENLWLAVETHPDTLCDNVPAILETLKETNHENLKLCFQPFDFANTDQTIADFDQLKEWVIHVHVQGRAGGNYVLLRNANLDYKRLFAALQESGFAGHLSVEFVKDGIVTRPHEMKLKRVLKNAASDRQFILDWASENSWPLLG